MAELDAHEAPETPAETAGERRVSTLSVLLLVAVVAAAGYVGINVLGVLFAVVSPPLPPLPPNLTETSHENVAYGVDYWRYTSPEDGCVLVRYLEQNGGVCQVAPMQCAAPENGQGVTAVDGIVGRCDGKLDFSIFTMNWTGLIIRESSARTQLQLDREVFWLGTGQQ